MQYYDGTKLLSLKDKNGNVPEIYISTSNRSAGKTTYFNRYLINRFKKHNEKFMLLYRFNYELDNCADKFFKEIKSLFFPDDIMTSNKRQKGVYHELFFNDVSCGYAVSINSADNIKKLSHFFADTVTMLFDEFQSETNNYCSNEVEKFISIHTSVSRGGGKQVRRVPVIMISNHVTLLNPYYTALDISSKLQNDTVYLKGDGFVLEQGFNESVAKKQKESAFNSAFENSDYMSYNTEKVYLNDNSTFIEKVSGKNRYLATIKYNGKDFAIREYAEQGIVYCDENVDSTYPYKIAVTTDDHNINYVILKQNEPYIALLRYFFEHGCFRFKNLECKKAILMLLSR